MRSRICIIVAAAAGLAVLLAVWVGGSEGPMGKQAADRTAREPSAAGTPQAPTGGVAMYANDAGLAERQAMGGASVSAPAAAPVSGKSAAASLATIANSQPDRYLIKNATVVIEAGDVEKAEQQLVAAAQAARGYVADMKEAVDGLGARTTTITVRVPYTAFDRAMRQLADLGKVLDRQVTAEDVTEEFVDTQARVRNLKQTELRLLDHLSRAGRLSDTLLVEKELNRVRQEIEENEGRVRFLAHRIAFSTITVTLQPKARPQPLTPPETYSAGKEGSDAVRALVGFGEGLLTLLIWVAVWLPVWGPFVVGGALGVRAYRKRAKRSRPAPAYPVYMAPNGPQPPVAPGAEAGRP